MESLPESPSPLPAPLGSSLSSPHAPLPPLARSHGNPWPGPALTQDGVHGGRRAHTGPLPQVPLVWEPAAPGRVAAEAWRRLPAKPPPEAVLGQDLSCSWESYMELARWSAWHPRQMWSPVTIRLLPPERRGSPRAAPGQGARSAGRPGAEGSPDPCAKETVLRALSQCRKGRRKFDGPLWFEIPESTSRTRDPEPRPSAFKPLIKNGEAPAFVPRPGPLHRTFCPWSCIIFTEGTDPGPHVRPSLSVAGPTAGTVAAQGAEPQPESWGKMGPCRGRGPPSSAQSRVGRVSLAPENAQPAGPCGC